MGEQEKRKRTFNTPRTRRASFVDGKEEKMNSSSSNTPKFSRSKKKRKLNEDETQEVNPQQPSKVIKIQNNDMAFNSVIDNWSWERVIGSGNCELSELLIDKDAMNSLQEGDVGEGLAHELQKLAEKEQKEALDNPTPAMKIIMKRLEEKSKKKEKKIGFPLTKSPSFRGKSRLPKSPGGKNVARSVSWDLTPNSFTPAMEEIMRKKSRRHFRRRFRHTSSDAPETKDVSLDAQESTEEDENSQANTVDLTSNLKDPAAESI